MRSHRVAADCRIIYMFIIYRIRRDNEDDAFLDYTRSENLMHMLSPFEM